MLSKAFFFLDFSFSFKLARLREVRSVPYFTEFYKIIRYKIIRRVDGIKDPVCATMIETQLPGEEGCELFKHRLYRLGLIEYHGRKTLTIYFNVLMETAGKK